MSIESNIMRPSLISRTNSAQAIIYIIVASTKSPFNNFKLAPIAVYAWLDAHEKQI